MLLILPAVSNAQIPRIMAQYPIDEPSKDNLNDAILGKWKFEEDTDKRNFYEIIREEPYMLDRYHIKFWNRGGTNPTYESNLHFSKVGQTRFINMPWFGEHFANKGFFFLKVLDVSPDKTRMTAAVVHDTTLWNLSQAEVKQRITRNVNNPFYYFDTVHLYKLRQ